MSLKKAKRINPVLIWLLSAFYKLFSLTLRKKIIFTPEFQSHLYSGRKPLIAFWHKDIVSLVHISIKYRSLTMSSDSKDAQIVVQLLERFGAAAARGSSRNNPIKALKGFIRLMKTEKYWAAITVDGPKGPAKKAKPGILEVSRLCKTPIFTASVAYSSYWTLSKSWDLTVIPKPFSKVIYHFGPGLDQVTKNGEDKTPELLTSLENSLSRNEEAALGLLT